MFEKRTHHVSKLLQRFGAQLNYIAVFDWSMNKDRVIGNMYTDYFRHFATTWIYLILIMFVKTYDGQPLAPAVPGATSTPAALALKEEIIEICSPCFSCMESSTGDLLRV